MIIKLKHDYFIEVDERNFTLKSEYLNKKTNAKATRTHGYYSSLLGNVEYERNRKKLDKAEEFNQLSAKKRKEYVALLKPYEGKKYFDIPFEVINKASALLKEAEKADKEYDKIMKEVL